MTNLFEKYGYAIDKLKIVNGRKESEFSIEFRIHKSNECYAAFEHAAQEYSRCFQVFRQEDLDRYTNKNFKPTEAEQAEYFEWLGREPNDSVFKLFRDNSQRSIANILLRERSLTKVYDLKQVNDSRFLWYGNGVFKYHEFVENNPIVLEALKSIRELRGYTYQPIKRTHTSDLFWILKTLDIFWS